MKHIPTLFLALVAAGSAFGADWLQFRGPGGTGTSSEKGLPTTWSSKENIVWRAEMPGPGTSCPIVVGKRVYITAYSGYGLVKGEGEMDKLMRHVVCLDREKGTILWTKDFKPVLPESKYGPGSNDAEHGYSSSTIASDGQSLFVFFGKSGVYRLDLDGKEIWNTSVGTGTHGWGSSNSPVLYKDMVIINACIENRCLVALNKSDGKEVWRTAKDTKINSSWSTPVLVESPKGTELVVTDNNNVLAFDPANGKEKWRVTGFNNYVCTSVVANKDIVYVVRTGAKAGSAMAIKSGGEGDVTDSQVIWRSPKSSLVPSPVYYEGRIYWPGGTAQCLDAETGKEVYAGRLKGDSMNFYASPLAADGKVYYVNRKSGVYVVQAGPEFKQLAFNKFEDDDSRSNASPIAHDGCLLLRTDKYLYCIGTKK
jgi:outer membrane protein assembly factor BamB